MSVGTHAVAWTIGAAILLPFVAQTAVVSCVVGGAVVCAACVKDNNGASKSKGQGYCDVRSPDALPYLKRK